MSNWKELCWKTLGCYDYCEDCTEEEKALKEIEYQFKKLHQVLRMFIVVQMEEL